MRLRPTRRPPTWSRRRRRPRAATERGRRGPWWMVASVRPEPTLRAMGSHSPGRDQWRNAMPAGFAWPAGYRAAACFTFDLDAESPILFDHPEAAGWLDVMTHQAYGARAGIPRILRVLDRQQVRATFFIPGFTAERAPGICR